MNAEHTRQLWNDYPILYRGRKYPLTQSLIPFGFECGDGWFRPIQKLSAALELMNIYNRKYGVVVEATQTKQKFGSLRFYYNVTLADPSLWRKALAALASKYGVVIAEDDPYRDLRYSGEALPTIQSFDEEGWVVYMSSFSKYIAPGLRLGAAVVKNPLLLRKMVIGKQSADVHSPLLNQAIVDAYLRKGLMPGHLERICGDYRKQLEAMLEGFKSFPAGTTHTLPQGGLFVWAELPEGVDAMKAFEAAVEAGVAFVPGTHFYPDGGHLNTLRLNFSMCDIPTIQKGMQKLGSVIYAL